jgi:hypothetical protein
MRFSLLLPFIFSMMFTTTWAHAESVWPTDPRNDISDEQLSKGLMLAGGKLYSMVSDGKCDGGQREARKDCQIGKYHFSADTHYSVTGYLKATHAPNTLSPVLMVNSSLIYIRAGLEPSQQRAISVDIVETVLNRKLTDINPNDPDTLFDPRDRDLMKLVKRAKDKVHNTVRTESCGDIEEAMFRHGQTTACNFGSFFGKRTTDDGLVIYQKQSEKFDLFGHFGYGPDVVDATKSDKERTRQLLDFVNQVLHIKDADIVGLPNNIGDNRPSDDIVSLAKHAQDLTKDKDCSENASTSYLLGIETDCEIGGYFFKRTTEGNFEVRMRTGEGQTSAVFYIIDDKPLVPYFHFNDGSNTSAIKISDDLLHAFNKVDRSEATSTP